MKKKLLGSLRLPLPKQKSKYHVVQDKFRPAREDIIEGINDERSEVKETIEETEEHKG